MGSPHHGRISTMMIVSAVICLVAADLALQMTKPTVGVALAGMYAAGVIAGNAKPQELFKND